MAYIGVLIKAAAMLVFQTAGVVVPRNPGQGFVNRDTVINLTNGLILFALKFLVLSAVLNYLNIGLFDLRWLPEGPAQFVFAFLLLDFTRYWVHYADHRVPWLWTFHRVHHSSERLDATSGLRMHLVDFLQLASIPVVLFGLIFDGSTLAPWVLPAALAVADVFDAFQHSNVRWTLNNPLMRAWHRVLNNPLFHSWHHTRDGALCDGNYGNTLLLWDRLFKTEVTQPEPPVLMGLGGDQVIDDHSLIGLQLLRPREASQEASVA